MNQDVKRAAKEIVSQGIAKIVRNYTGNALLINACFVASDRYKSLDGTSGLSTISGIPAPLRLDNEIDVIFTNQELEEKYKTDSVSLVCRNYLIFSISVVDAVLEDAYEVFIRELEKGISDADIEKKVRAAWTNDNLINYFCDKNKVGLKKPEGMKTELPEAFMRYKELRIIRHALVHSDGVISDKNLSQLKSFKESTPDERKGMALLGSPIINDKNEVFVSINVILSVRQYLDRFLMYIYRAVSDA